MVAYNLLSNHNFELTKPFHPLRAQFNASLNAKTMKILHAANIKSDISDNELLDVMKVVYDNMFLNDMYKIVTALLKGDNAHAQKLSDDLLKLYTRLINVLLYGILSEKPKE